MMSPQLVIKLPLSDTTGLLERIDWQQHSTQGRSGALIHEIYRTGRPARRLALVRFTPGSSAPAHRHLGHETIHVLEGGFDDDFGSHKSGDLVVYPPDSVHAWSSPRGALLLVLWDGPTQLL